MHLFPITVDTRQRSPKPGQWASGLIKKGYEASVNKLILGDFYWDVEWNDGTTTGFVVEHKTARDLVNSVYDGRLASFTQTGTMAIKVLFLIWSGAAIRGDVRKWTNYEVEALLASMQANGIFVWRCPSKPKAIDSLAKLINWTIKEQHRSLDRPVLPTAESFYLSEDHRNRARTLISYPGIGEIVANNLLSRYQTIARVNEGLTNKTALTVEGMGPISLEKARRHIYDRWD